MHGAESALYGSDAMSGAVQILTKRGDTRTPELDLTGDGGSFGTGHGAAELSGVLGKLDYAVGATYFSTAGQGPNDAFYNRALNGNFGWKFSDTDTLRVSFRHNTSDAGIPGQTLFEPPDLFQTNDQHDFSMNAAWDAQRGPHWMWHVAVNDTDLRTNDTEANPDPDFAFSSISQFNRVQGTAQTTYSFNGVALTGGYQYEVENGFPSAITPEHARRNNQAGYFDARWQATKRLTLTAGMRADANTSFGTHVVPRVGGAYLLRAGNGQIGDTRLHAFYSQGIDEPRLDQSFGTDPCFPGNPNLLPEESRTSSAGIDQSFAANRIHLSADYFYTELHNVISFASVFPSPLPLADECPFGTGTYFNTDLALARGVNLSGETRLMKRLTFSGHYSYDNTLVVKAPNAFDPSQKLREITLLRRPVNSGVAELNYSRDRFSGNILGYFSGVRTDSDFLGLGLTHNPGYARIDIAASAIACSGHATLFVRVGNLFNKQYQDALGYPALGREIRVGLKLKIGGGVTSWK